MGRGPRFRRARGLVVHWAANGLVCVDCLKGRRIRVTPEVVRFLDGLEEWTTVTALAKRPGMKAPHAEIERHIRRLARLGLIETGTTPASPWAAWMPEAAFFHFGTRARTFAADPRDQDVQLRAKARDDPPPASTKHSPGKRRSLPQPVALGAMSDCLLARRTWRNFEPAPLPLPDIATLLQLTWGVQQRGAVKGLGSVVLKTSPSAGARHPVEAYLLALRVQDLPAGAYHYDADSHELVDLRRRMTPARLQRLIGNQDYYRDAAAVIIMTAVVARSMWKYPRSRAYRAMLLDAGHLGQTFCLAATALGLAPFCTMAFAESPLERLLRVDGVSECAIYAVGVGTRATGYETKPGRIPPRKGTP